MVELIIAVAILVTLAGIASIGWSSYRNDTNDTRAKADLVNIENSIELYRMANHRYPPDLKAIGMDTLRDPWGNPYQYLDIADGGLHGNSAQRKDRNLVPINSDYDLYSMGPDGQSKPPITAKVSRDDIIRANDGKYLGLASDY